MIRKTIFSVSTEETRYVLNGVYFEIKKDEMKMVATDGRRMAYITDSIKCPFEKKDVIVPHKVLAELEKNLQTEGVCKIGISENQIFFDFNNISLISRLIEGQFPDYENVIPKKHEMIVKFFTKKIQSGVERIALMASEKYNRVIFGFQKNKVILKSNDPVVGDATEEIDIGYDYNDMELAFNSAFLIDMMRVADSEEINFYLSSPNTAAIIKEKDNDNYSYIVMPMKIT